MQVVDKDWLFEKLTERDWKDFDIVLLLGAGCSLSSGIPLASELSRRWLVELRKKDPQAFPGLSEKDSVKKYYEICMERWRGQAEIKSEIGRFTSKAKPSIGYITLASYLANQCVWHKSRKIKTILTTNFDDMLEQAFVIYTSERPTVIPDPVLIDSLKSHRDKIQIIKVHGDSRHNPKNIQQDTKELASKVFEKLSQQISDSVLIVLGYSGNDEDLATAIVDWLYEDVINTVVWVDTNDPGEPVSNYAREKGLLKSFVRVNWADFDGLMLEWSEAIKSHSKADTPTDLPSLSRAQMHTFYYHNDLMWRLGLHGDDGNEPITLNKNRFTDYFRYFVEAAEYVRANKTTELANLLSDGYRLYSQIPNFIVFYASVAKSALKNRKLYGDLCESAVKVAPDHAAAHAEIALFYKESNNRALAIKHFEKAIALEPSDWNVRLNYCGYLLASNIDSEIHQGREVYEDCKIHLYDPKHRLELAFYAYAHGLPHIGALHDIHYYLSKNNKSPNFDLSVNVQKAKAESHTNYHLVSDIADVITDRPFSTGFREELLEKINQEISVGAS